MPIINIKPHPFKQQRFQTNIPEGCTIAELLPEDRTYFNVYVNGRSFDDQAPLGKNDIVDISVIPKGTGDTDRNREKALIAGGTILTGGISGIIGGASYGFLGLSGGWAGLTAGGVTAGLQLPGELPFHQLLLNEFKRKPTESMESISKRVFSEMITKAEKKGEKVGGEIFMETIERPNIEKQHT